MPIPALTYIAQSFSRIYHRLFLDNIIIIASRMFIEDGKKRCVQNVGNSSRCMTVT